MATPRPNTNIKNTQENPRQTRSILSSEQRANRRLFRKSPRISVETTRYGYVNFDGNKIPDEYLVKITSLNSNVTIIAPFQEDLSLGVESTWEPVIPAGILRTLNTAVQAVTSVATSKTRSAITSATTRRMWQGTSPISVTLTLRFEAVQDEWVEVVEPCRLLQSIAVPSNPSSSTSTREALSNYANQAKNANVSGIKNTVSDLPALLPPGPSPFTWDNLFSGQTNFLDASRSSVEKSAAGGDFIMVELGTFLTFWMVIVREVNISYNSKFSNEGYPVSATAEVTFETYEMPTKESLEHSYTSIVPPEPTKVLHTKKGPVYRAH